MTVTPGPVPNFPAYVLITGPEEVLVQRAIDQTLVAARERAPEAEVVRISAEAYAAGDLLHHASPSLFGGTTILVVTGLDAASDDLVGDLERLLAGPPEVVLVVTHRGGNRAKKLLGAFESAGARTIAAPAIKSDSDKASFVSNEFRAAGRRIGADAVQALVRAVGKDVRELASACAQLIADTSGVVSVEVVDTYYGGRHETTAFKVAEAALRGSSADALRLLRHALSNGIDPVPMVAVLAGQLRQVGRVASAGSGSPQAVARELKIADWQVRQARDLARGWSGATLGEAITAVAAADVEVKGGSRDPEFAVERAVLRICQLRAGT